MKHFTIKVLLFLLLPACIQAQQRSAPYVIPVVFHILHQGGAENISDAQVLDAMRILNEDYNKRNADTANVVAAFKNNIADMQVEFRLANLDPNGQCTNGIEHIYSSLTYQGGNFSKINQWPPDKYLNIWVVYKLPNGIGGFSVTAWGASTYPKGDGIILTPAYIGSIGMGSPITSRALTYFTGQYLNLLNTSAWTTCGEDSVSDTPVTSGTGSCNLTLSQCNPPVIENVQNFMSGDFCSCMFTNGQKARVHATLSSSVAGRNNLSAPANLIATGTDDASVTPCKPICDFSVNRRYVCLGDPVVFTDRSYNAAPPNRLWTFQNANISNSTDSAVAVTFNTIGPQSATLIATNSEGSSTKTQTLVFVSDAAQFGVPYYNSFENPTDFAQNWAPVNIDNDAPAFQHTATAGHVGSSSVLLSNFYSTADRNADEFISPAFDCSALTNTDAQLIFWYASANKESVNMRDSVTVYASKTCGSTWTKIYSASPATTLIVENVAPYFTPSQAANWHKVIIPLQPTWRTASVRFKIQAFGSHNSNNFYLDDFIIGPEATDINDEAFETIQLSPNPTNANVYLSGLSNGTYTIDLFDVTGKWLKQQKTVNPDSGTVAVDLSSIKTAGIYLLKVFDGARVKTMKIIRQ